MKDQQYGNGVLVRDVEFLTLLESDFHLNHSPAVLKQGREERAKRIGTSSCALQNPRSSLEDAGVARGGDVRGIGTYRQN